MLVSLMTSNLIPRYRSKFKYGQSVHVWASVLKLIQSFVVRLLWVVFGLSLSKDWVPDTQQYVISSANFEWTIQALVSSKPLKFVFEIMSFHIWRTQSLLRLGLNTAHNNLGQKQQSAIVFHYYSRLKQQNSSSRVQRTENTYIQQTVDC